MKRILGLALVVVFLSSCAISINTGGGGAASGDGGMFFSVDRGVTWEQRVFVRDEESGKVTLNNANVGFFYLHPEDGATVYMSTLEQGLWKTVNNGETWTPTPLSNGFIQGFDINAKDPKLMFAGVANTVQYSADAGETWNVVYTNQPGNTITAVRFDPANSRHIYAATNGGVLLESDDQGVTWRILYQFPGMGLERLTILQNDPSIMFLLVGGTLYRSTDRGVTWSDSIGQALGKAGAVPLNHFTYTERNPGTMYAATNAGLYRSRDGGASWQVVPTVIPPNTVPILSVAINPFDEKELFFTANSTFYRSQDGGETWQTLQNVPSARQLRTLLAHPRRPAVLYIGTYIPRK